MFQSTSRPTWYSFSNRVIDTWNALSDDVVTAPSINSFKNRLNKQWKNHPLKFTPSCYSPQTDKETQQMEL